MECLGLSRLDYASQVKLPLLKMTCSTLGLIRLPYLPSGSWCSKLSIISAPGTLFFFASYLLHLSGFESFITPGESLARMVSFRPPILFVLLFWNSVNCIFPFPVSLHILYLLIFAKFQVNSSTLSPTLLKNCFIESNFPFSATEF